MAKINPILGKISGKIGALVYATQNGENIVREKAATVFNPNTALQVESRAKLKLMSQLTAVVAPVIAIKKEGNKNGRNLFISLNYGKCGYSEDAATVNLNQIQLTKGVASIAEFTANRASGTKIAVSLNEDMSERLDKVIYVCVEKQADGTLNIRDSKVVSAAGQNGDFAAEMAFTDKAVVVYAYGMKENTDKAKASFGSMNAPTAEQVAKLLASRTISTSDVTLTSTKGLTMLVGEDEKSSDDVENILVTATASGNGSVSGGGRYPIGTLVTLHATPVEEATFEGWHKDSVSGQLLSTNANYQFEASESITIVGKFVGGPTPKYQISVSAQPVGDGSVSGGGEKEEGTTCTVVATPASGKIFTGWYENSQLVSSSASYAFTVERARTLVAHFADEPAGPFANVTMNGEAFDENEELAANNQLVVAGNCGSQNVTGVAIVVANSKPTAGQNIKSLTRQTGSLSAGSFSITLASASVGTWWLASINQIDENTINVVDVYDYSIEVYSDQ